MFCLNVAILLKDVFLFSESLYQASYELCSKSVYLYSLFSTLIHLNFFCFIYWYIQSCISDTKLYSCGNCVCVVMSDLPWPSVESYPSCWLLSGLSELLKLLNQCVEVEEESQLGIIQWSLAPRSLQPSFLPHVFGYCLWTTNVFYRPVRTWMKATAKDAARGRRSTAEISLSYVYITFQIRVWV